MQRNVAKYFGITGKQKKGNTREAVENQQCYRYHFSVKLKEGIHS